MSTNHDMKNKAVSFNLLDPDQLKLYEHAMKRKNFSAYIKRLIQRDIDNAFAPRVIHAQAEQTEEVFEFNDDLLTSLI